MKMLLISLVALSGLSLAAPVYAGCEWGQRSTCVDSSHQGSTVQPKNKVNNSGNRQINDLGGVRRG